MRFALFTAIVSLAQVSAHMGISSPVPLDKAIGDAYRNPVSSDNNPTDGGACHGRGAGARYVWVWTPRNSGTCEIYQNCFRTKPSSLTMSGGAHHGGGPCGLYECSGSIGLPSCNRMSLPSRFGGCNRIWSANDCTVAGRMGPGGGSGPSPPATRTPVTNPPAGNPPAGNPPAGNPPAGGTCVSKQPQISDAFCQAVKCASVYKDYCGSGVSASKVDEKDGCRVHIVEDGHTWEHVATEFDTDVETLKRENPDVAVELPVGSSLFIACPSTSATSSATSATTASVLALAVVATAVLQK